MRTMFYPRLAWTGIQKNRRLYLPYLLTCAAMAAMHYIVGYLASAETLLSMPGATTIQTMMQLGSWIIALFAALFLLYTNSFLIRRRQREFGLYNILGMGKRNIAAVLLWETAITAGIALGAGLPGGIALSKLVELGLVNIMQGDVSYRMMLSLPGIAATAAVFGVIFLLILFRGLWQLGRKSAISLLRSESAGEKPPKASWLWGSLGALLLAAAYWIALSIQDPLSAMLWFFAAVALVILATYLLFQSGSVLLCRVLQRNTGYYYKPNHFVSVSSMVYRMKRNGSGLASICILLTMVLVMLSSTSCLYFGAEDALRTRYPRDFMVDVYLNDPAADTEPMRQFAIQVAADHGASLENILDYRSLTITGMLAGSELRTDYRELNALSPNVYGDVRILHFMDLADFERMTGEKWELAANEVLLHCSRGNYAGEELIIGERQYRIARQLKDFPISADVSSNVMATMYVVVPDFEAAAAALLELRGEDGDSLSSIHWFYGFDLNVGDAQQIRIYRDLYDRAPFEKGDALGAFYFESRALNQDDFYGTFGGFFYLGIMLSIVFLFAAVLIIYYKQISEGYEDQGRFGIMQKIGMTGRDIRRSINSQMLTVFFLPLLFAGLHLIFAFPMIRKLLLLFNMDNVSLFVLTTLISFFLFGLLYAAVYRITSNAYCEIVSGGRQEG